MGISFSSLWHVLQQQVLYCLLCGDGHSFFVYTACTSTTGACCMCCVACYVVMVHYFSSMQHALQPQVLAAGAVLLVMW